MTTLGASVGASSLIAHYPATTSQAIRYSVAALALGLILRLRRQSLPRLTPRDWGQVILLALAGLVGFNLCLLAALRYAEPAGVGVIVGCAPLVLALTGPLMRREMPRSRLLAAAVIVTIGAAVTQGAGSASPLGLLFSLGALLGEAAFSLLAVSLLPRLGPMCLSAYLCTVASVTFILLAPIVDGPHAATLPTFPQMAAIGYLALAVTAGAFVAWYAGLARLGVERAGLFAGLIPISSLVSGVILGSGTLTLLRLLGVGLVGVGVTLGLAAGQRRGSDLPRTSRHEQPVATAGFHAPPRLASDEGVAR